MSQQLTGREKMVPVSPSTLSDWLLSVIPTYDRLRRYKPNALPLIELSIQQFKNLSLSGEVGGIRRCVAAFSLRINPTNAIKPFLEYIVGTRYNIFVRPLTQT